MQWAGPAAALSAGAKGCFLMFVAFSSFYSSLSRFYPFFSLVFAALVIILSTD